MSKRFEDEADQIEKQLKIHYRNTFAGRSGRLTLAHILRQLRYLGAIKSEEDRALHNFARFLLNMLEIDEEQLHLDLVNKCLSLPPRGEAETKGETE